MPTNSDVGSKLLAWLMAGVGSLLAYSAIRGRSPLNVLRDIDDTPTSPQGFGSGLSDQSGATFPNPSGSMQNTSSEIVRARALANREVAPDWTPIKQSGKLDRIAAASLNRIQQKIGYTFPNVGADRSYAYQAAQYASDPKRFGDPKKSLHVVGLAIDVHEDYVKRPELIAAFTAEGWHRPRADEPWHWSYLVRG